MADIETDLDFIVGATAEISRPVIVGGYGGSPIVSHVIELYSPHAGAPRSDSHRPLLDGLQAQRSLCLWVSGRGRFLVSAFVCATVRRDLE